MAATAAAVDVEQRCDGPLRSDGAGGEADFGVCAVCLEKIALAETALVKGCEHAYCVTCILRWASYKEAPSCPQCKYPFEFLHVHRSLDGCIHDYLFEESVCLLLRASWFVPLEVDAHYKSHDDPEDFFYEYEDEQDDLEEDAYYGVSHSPNIRIGNRRWGSNGYVRTGRKEARPVQYVDNCDAGPSHGPRNKKAVAKDGPTTVKDGPVTGRRSKRAQKRGAADKENAAKHQHNLQRLGRI